MTRETLTDTLLPTLGLITMLFLYRKVYYHFKFLGLHYPKLKDKSILELIFNPITFLEHFYIVMPIFIKSDKKKEGEELRLETKIINSTRTFWIMFVIIIVMGLIINWDTVKQRQKSKKTTFIYMETERVKKQLSVDLRQVQIKTNG